jgi:hypothetical protein
MMIMHATTRLLRLLPDVRILVEGVSITIHNCVTVRMMLQVPTPTGLQKHRRAPLPLMRVAMQNLGKLKRTRRTRRTRKTTKSYVISPRHRAELGQGCAIYLAKRLSECVIQAECVAVTRTKETIIPVEEVWVMTHFQVTLLQVVLVLEGCFRHQHRKVRHKAGHLLHHINIIHMKIIL